MSVELNVPERIIGDLINDITSKRNGRVLGIRNVKVRFSDND